MMMMMIEVRRERRKKEKEKQAVQRPTDQSGYKTGLCPLHSGVNTCKHRVRIYM